MDPDLKEYFYNFLNNHTLAVISSIYEQGTPQAAVVGFVQTKELELIIGTDNSSRKYKNLQTNPKVALVIGWDNGETIQYEGSVRELSPEEIGLVRGTYWAKSPHTERNNENPGERYFIVSPSWIRYTDLKAKPWIVKELKF
jgi:pyridoxine/pyridoxamine 5'-phosphate oxidase